MPLVLVLGAQFGDEGKGKVVDFLAASADIVVRFNGGDNAGHTVVVGKDTFKFHLMPSGSVHRKLCCLASGVAINPKTLAEEISMLKKRGLSPKLKIDSRSQIIMPYHIILDSAMETGKAKIGTTKRGIGPCYADRASRTGLRFCDFVEPRLFKMHLKKTLPFKRRELAAYGKKCPSEKEILREYLPLAKMLKRYEADVSVLVHNALKEHKYVMLEGAQGFYLDNDFGTYPYVTSSRTTTCGALLSVGVWHKPERIIGVAKAYCTRVGSGPFVTELQGKLADRIRACGNEYGTTTGRPRRVGWLDLPMLRTASRICGFTELAIMKLDVISGLKKVKVCEAYKLHGRKIREVLASTALLEKCRPVYKKLDGFELPERMKSARELPKEALAYLNLIEKSCGVPIKIISYGPERTQTILKK